MYIFSPFLQKYTSWTIVGSRWAIVDLVCTNRKITSCQAKHVSYAFSALQNITLNVGCSSECTSYMAESALMFVGLKSTNSCCSTTKLLRLGENSVATPNLPGHDKLTPCRITAEVKMLLVECFVCCSQYTSVYVNYDHPLGPHSN